jgi:cysteinyl-tRNA synthetase
MSMKHLGESFDIHTGGIDLIFPHHEDEIAQSEAATGHEFVRTWLHCAHLQMGGEKMARSVGNIARVDEVLAGGVSARALRYALIAVHYRAPLAYSDASLTAASAAIERLDAVHLALAAYHEEHAGDPSLPAVLEAARAAFGDALDDDLNVSAALAALFELVREVNRRIDGRTLSTADAARAEALIRELGGVLAIEPDAAQATLEPELTALLEARSAARAARDWATSDRLRDDLAAAGVVVEDSRDGQRWRRAGSDG